MRHSVRRFCRMSGNAPGWEAVGAVTHPLPHSVRRNHVMPQQRSSTVRLRTSLFEEAVAIVSEEYERDLALDEIARRVASSRRQLQRAYAEIGHTTFRSHLTGVRMDAAADLLARGPLTVR